MKKTSTLNNANAYGFCKNGIRPVIIDVLESNGYKCTIPTSTKDFTPITIKTKKGNKAKEMSVIGYMGTETIAVSMYNMLGNKDLVFIADNKVYIVNIADLQANWSAAMASMSKYHDGCGTASEMSHMKPDFLKSMASTIAFDMSEDTVSKYNAAYHKFTVEINTKK